MSKTTLDPRGAGAAASAAALAAADVLIAFGGKAAFVKAEAGADLAAPAPAAIKADGYLVRFTGADDPDITALKDFFTAETYFGEAKSVPVYFHHGLPIEAKAADGSVLKVGPMKTKIGTGALSVDETGVFIDAVIDEAGEYQAAVQQMLDAGLLGWSSGVPSHLVVREPVTDASGTTKAHHVRQWLLAEGSMTHTPAEPRNVASAPAPQLTSVKSLLADYGAYSWDYEHGHCDDWDASQKMSTAAADVLTWRLEKAVRNVLCDDKLTPQQQVETIGGVFDEAKGLLVKLVSALASIGAEGEAETELLAEVKTAFSAHVPAGEPPDTGSKPGGGATLSVADQGERVLEDLKAYVGRAERVEQLRRGAGLPAGTLGGVAAKAAEILSGAGVGVAAPAAQTPPAPTATPPSPAPAPDPVIQVKAADPAALEAALQRARSLGVSL